MDQIELSRIFVELPSFVARWKALGLSDGDLLRLELDLLANPKIGPVLKGTGGVRKVRFAFEIAAKVAPSASSMWTLRFTRRSSCSPHMQKPIRITLQKPNGMP